MIDQLFAGAVAHARRNEAWVCGDATAVRQAHARPETARAHGVRLRRVRVRERLGPGAIELRVRTPRRAGDGAIDAVGEDVAPVVRGYRRECVFAVGVEDPADEMAAVEVPDV